jgi:hypothetical protein
VEILAGTLLWFALSLVPMALILWGCVIWIRRRIRRTLEAAEAELRRLDLDPISLTDEMTRQSEKRRAECKGITGGRKLKRLRLPGGIVMWVSPVGMCVVPLLLSLFLLSVASNPCLLILVLVFFAVALPLAFGMMLRGESLRIWAQARGLNHHPARDMSVQERYPGIPEFRGTGASHARNRVSGEWNVGQGVWKVETFDYTVFKKIGKRGEETESSHFSAVVVTSDIPLEPLRIRPERALDAVADLFGAGDINFESAQFSREFHVKAPNRRWAYDVLHVRAMQFLLDQPRFTLHFGTNSVVAMHPCRSIFSIAEFEQAIRVVCGILDRLPGYVRNQHGAPSSESGFPSNLSSAEK